MQTITFLQPLGIFLPTVSIGQVTATTAVINYSVNDLSLPVSEYSLSVQRVTGSGQVLCPGVRDNQTLTNLHSSSTSRVVTNLEEYSDYTVTVTVQLRGFTSNLFPTASSNINAFRTQSAGMFPINVCKTGNSDRSLFWLFLVKSWEDSLSRTMQ